MNSILTIHPGQITKNISSASAGSGASPSVQKVSAVAQGRFDDLGKGLDQSRLLRGFPFLCLAITGAVLLATNPAGWILLAIAISALAIGGLVLLAYMAFVLVNKQEKETLSFEMGAIKRLFKTNHSEIILPNIPEGKGKLFLSALPNRLRQEGEYLAKEEGVNVVVSFNKDWERRPVGLSLPYSKTDWESLGVTYKTFDSEDHVLLPLAQLHEAADFIHGQIEAGKNVVVHCKAGRGRSAMGVAAYLIKYCQMTVAQAQLLILKYRKGSTIAEKVTRLEEFYADVNQPVFYNAELNGENHNAVAAVTPPPVVEQQPETPPSDNSAALSRAARRAATPPQRQSTAPKAGEQSNSKPATYEPNKKLVRGSSRNQNPGAKIQQSALPRPLDIKAVVSNTLIITRKAEEDAAQQNS